jgi:hypothetical protein
VICLLFNPKNSIYFRIQINQAAFICLPIYWSKKMKEIQIHPAPQPGQPDNPYIINQNHIFFLDYCEVISG